MYCTPTQMADAKLVRELAQAATPERMVIPADAVTTSGSGLDPDVSPAYARLQAARIARARGVPVQQVQSIIDAHIEGAFLGFIGQPHVNVLLTNRALDARFGAEG